MINNFIDSIRKLFGYYHVYSDLDGNSLYLKRSFSYEDKLLHKQQVIRKFGHLKYFFKGHVGDSKKVKVSSAAFKNSQINNDKCFIDHDQ